MLTAHHVPERAHEALDRHPKANRRWLPLAVTVLFLLITSGGGLAQSSKTGVLPLAPTKPSQIVVLQNESTPCPVGFGGWVADIQVLPDGSTAAFTGIPAGQVLVLTGLSFVAARGSSTFDSTQILLMNVNPTSVAGPGAPWLFHSGVQAIGTHVAGGAASLHNAVVKPGSVLCIVATEGYFVQAIIHGFLAKDE